MYHCHVHFYLIGRQHGIWDTIQAMPPLEHFTHTFTTGAKPDAALLADADIIFANLQGMDAPAALKTISDGRRREAELILLADANQIALLSSQLAAVKDIWTMPMSEAEIQFRFLRWQQSYKMEKDFWQTSQYFETTINSIPNLIWYKDKNGIHKKVNDSFCLAVGKTKKQVEGRDHAYIWNVEQEDPACVQSEQKVMTQKSTFVSEETIQTGDGKKLLMTYKSPLYDLDGSVTGTVGVAIDVTQERAYEQEIINKNHTLETIFTSLDCGVMCHSIDGSKILSINKAALDILGYETQEEMETAGFKMIADSVLDGDKKVLHDAICSLQQIGDSSSIEYRVKHEDGKLLHVMGRIKLLEENGQLFYQRFLLDCTEKKLKEEQQQMQQEQRHRELIHALGIDFNLICYFNLDTGIGNTLRIRSCKYNILQAIFTDELQLEDNLGRYIQMCVYSNDKKMMTKALSRKNLLKELKEKKTFHVNYRTLCNNTVRYFQMKAVRAGSWEQNHSIVLGFCSIDEEIRSEMEKKNLLENALMQANMASMAKSAFLSNMSHDLRTPMNAIIGFTNLAITRKDEPEKLDEYLQKILASGQQLLRLIDDVLDMSRLKNGKISLEEEPCNLPEVLYHLYNLVQADVNAKQQTLYIDASDVYNEEVYCDKRINQILLNILNNAIQYTGNGGTIHIKLIEKPSTAFGYANYEFSIKDNGIGMDQAFLAHIFEPFERERNTTFSGIQGSGLGMTITKNLVDLMNGTITIDSRQGIGSVVTVAFTFRLHSVQNSLTVKETAPSAKESAAFGAERILLVEDNEINQEIAAEILKAEGFSVDIAENGKIALDMLQSACPGYYQLVLMDIQMPVMNGYEATKAIRSLTDPVLSSIPIIAVTANALEEDKRTAMNLGMNAYVTKPIDISCLYDTMHKILH